MLSNAEYLGGSLLVLLLLFLLARNIIKTSRANTQLEGLCMNPSASCRDTTLVPYLSNPKSISVEPRNPWESSSMVIPEKLPNSYENVKNNYLVKANQVYLDYDNDVLNKELLPHGLLFAV